MWWAWLRHGSRLPSANSGRGGTVGHREIDHVSCKRRIRSHYRGCPAASGGLLTDTGAEMGEWEAPIHIRRDMLDPAPELAELRDGPGVVRVGTHLGVTWLVTRLADVRAVMSDQERFSNSRGTEPAQARGGDPLLPE